MCPHQAVLPRVGLLRPTPLLGAQGLRRRHEGGQLQLAEVVDHLRARKGRLRRSGLRFVEGFCRVDHRDQDDKESHGCQLRQDNILHDGKAVSTV